MKTPIMGNFTYNSELHTCDNIINYKKWPICPCTNNNHMTCHHKPFMSVKLFKHPYLADWDSNLNLEASYNLNGQAYKPYNMPKKAFSGLYHCNNWNSNL